MTKEELKALLEDNLRVDVNFSSYSYEGNNRFKVEISFDGETICSETCYIDPTTERDY